MSVLDKQGIIKRALSGETFTLELGCGNQKKDPSAVGIDMLDFPCVDLVGDAFEVLAQFPDGSIDKISSSHFIEHIPDVSRLMAELSRVLKKGGELKVVVPHFSNPFYYSDPTHRSPFGLYTMAYYCEQSLFSRGVPSYAIGLPLVLRKITLGFKSIRPRYISHSIKLVVGSVINCSMYTMEFYEENLCWLFPCYELRMEIYKK
jgi:SAM-dependent methyltransferase